MEFGIQHKRNDENRIMLLESSHRKNGGVNWAVNESSDGETTWIKKKPNSPVANWWRGLAAIIES